MLMLRPSFQMPACLLQSCSLTATTAEVQEMAMHGHILGQLCLGQATAQCCSLVYDSHYWLAQLQAGCQDQLAALGMSAVPCNAVLRSHAVTAGGKLSESKVCRACANTSTTCGAAVIHNTLCIPSTLLITWCNPRCHNLVCMRQTICCSSTCMAHVRDIGCHWQQWYVLRYSCMACCDWHTRMLHVVQLG